MEANLQARLPNTQHPAVWRPQNSRQVFSFYVKVLQTVTTGIVQHAYLSENDISIYLMICRYVYKSFLHMLLTTMHFNCCFPADGCPEGLTGVVETTGQSKLLQYLVFPMPNE